MAPGPADDTLDIRDDRDGNAGFAWDEQLERQCPVCWCYGGVECRRRNETGDRDPTNDRDLDCHYCQGGQGGQGWAAVTCTYCGGGGRR